MENSPLRAAMVVAPHINVEDITQKGVVATADWYQNRGLRQRLKRYHDQVDSTFWRWCRAWSSDTFKNWNIEAMLPSIRCPLLTIQGDEDEYASLEQIYGIKQAVPHAQLIVMPRVRHSPHVERPEQLLEHCDAFIKKLPV